MSAQDVATFVTLDDFQYLWRRVNGWIFSSYSGLRFSHYKVVVFDRELSIFHAAKTSACADKRVVLDRYGIGVTVLLETLWESTTSTS